VFKLALCGAALVVAGGLLGACAGGDDSPSTKIGRAVEDFKESRYRAEYTMTGGPGAVFPSGTMTWYKDGPDRIRFDVTTVEEGEQVELIILQSDEGGGYCFKNAGELGTLLGIDPAGGVCFESDGDDNAIADLAAGLTSPDFEASQLELVAESERTVAGLEARCYQTKDPDGDVSDTCFSEDGAMLYLRSDDGSSFEATSVSEELGDDVFKLPYEVRQAPGFPTD
jgi:hypothetical protein